MIVRVEWVDPTICQEAIVQPASGRFPPNQRVKMNLTRDTRRQMGQDKTALFTAEFDQGIWWIGRRIDVGNKEAVA
jgi:hypothetical protein